MNLPQRKRLLLKLRDYYTIKLDKALGEGDFSTVNPEEVNKYLIRISMIDEYIDSHMKGIMV